MFSAALKPNARLGRYPERADEQTDWLSRQATALFGYFKRRQRAANAYTQNLVAAIGQHGKALSTISETELVEERKRLRAQLVSKAHTPDLVAASFALVREYSERVMGKRHFDCQLIGGWAIYHGMLAEMQTGEGKTLTASLPAATAALAGIPVHVVTVNDYLATRDAQNMAPLYEALGLSVGVITERATASQRRAAYACDITYCTNKQLVFDYLKDRLVLGRSNGRIQLQVDRLDRENTRQQELLLRGLCFAIIDEADSVLIDEARTPLILSRAADGKSEQQIFIDGLAIVAQLRESTDYTIDFDRRHIEITEQGDARIAHLAEPLDGPWQSPRRRRELLTHGLEAMHLFTRDKHYLVRDDKVQIIDEYTGRTMPDRTWSRGLHQMIQAKEGVTISGRTETLVKISYQRFFRRYLNLGAMSGTAREVAKELESVYGLNVIEVPTHRPSQRRQEPERVYATRALKWQAVLAEIKRVHALRRPILIGTRTVNDSEALAKLIRDSGIDVAVLNARQDADEAAVIARAGAIDAVTVATSIAGRGTDIVLGEGVAALGGLHVILTERFDAARIDRQLYGRCARQGDPGSVVTLLSADDEIIVARYPRLLNGALNRLRSRQGALPRWAGSIPIRRAQRSLEREHARVRTALFRQDRQRSDHLAFAGKQE